MYIRFTICAVVRKARSCVSGSFLILVLVYTTGLRIGPTSPVLRNRDQIISGVAEKDSYFCIRHNDERLLNNQI